MELSKGNAKKGITSNAIKMIAIIERYNFSQIIEKKLVKNILA